MKRAGRRVSLQSGLFYLWVALLVANLGLLGAFTVPRSLQERSLERRAEQLRRDVEAARERNQALKVRDELAVRNAADLTRFYRSVVGTREQTLLPALRELEALARELRIGVGQQTYSALPMRDGPLVRFSIKTPVNGSYQQVVAFLDRLERSELFLTIDEISLHERPQDGAGSADLTLMFSAYFHDPDARRPAARRGRRAI